jgi:4-amino-4-deoxy-L-arabinose transferase-like glycosyltransferase
MSGAARAPRALLVVLALGLAVHLGLLALPRVARWDEPTYLLLGQSLWRGEGFGHEGRPELHHSPLYPLLAGATFRLTGEPEIASDVWFVLLGSLLPLPVYWLARRRTSERGALVAAVLAAAYPALTVAVLYWGTMTEPLFLLLVYGALALALRGADRERLGASAAAGLLLGLAYLARPEGALWVPAIAGGVAAPHLFRRTLSRRRLLGLAALCLVALAVSLPQLLFLRRHTGRWTLSGKLGVTYEIGRAVTGKDPVLYDEVVFGLAADGEIRAASALRFRAAEGAPAAGSPATGPAEAAVPGAAARGAEPPATAPSPPPSEVAARFTGNLLHVARRAAVSEMFSFLWLVPIAVWGWTAWRRRALLDELPLLATVVPVVSFLAFHVQQRFFAPALPGLLVWAAAGLEEMRRWLAARGVPAPGALLAVPVVAYLLWGDVVYARRGIATSDFAHEAAGRWLRRHTPEEARVMTRDTAIPIYGLRRQAYFPRAPWPRVLEYARSRGATHLAVDEREATELRPWLAFLFTEPPPGLRLVRESRDRHGRVRIFELPGARGAAPAEEPGERPAAGPAR